MSRLEIAMQPAVQTLLSDEGLDALASQGVIHLSLSRDFYDLEEDVIVERWAAMRSRGMKAITSHIPYGSNNGRNSCCSEDEEVFTLTVAMWQRFLLRFAITGMHSTPLHMSGCMHPAVPQRLRDRLTQTLEQILPVAEETGVIIALENTFYPNPPGFSDMGTEPIVPYQWLNDDCAMLADYVKSWDHPLIQVCFDIGHANLYGHTVLEDLDTLAPHLALLHVHDNDGSCDQHYAPWKGSIPWNAVAKRLDAMGFDGGVYAEILHDPDPELDARIRTPEMLASLRKATLEALTNPNAHRE